VSSTYVPDPPTGQPIALSRELLRLLALVDITTAGRRVLDVLLALSDPETGAAAISQNEMRACECGLAWSLKDGLYQLHPILTGGRVATTVMAVPEIKAADPAQFTEQRRTRYAAQLANLSRTA
jgi:hypothetical protein